MRQTSAASRKALSVAGFEDAASMVPPAALSGNGGFKTLSGSAEAARQRVEEALDIFLTSIPAWRGGQRDVGQVGASRSRSRRRAAPEKKDRRERRDRERDTRSPSPAKKKKKGEKDKEEMEKEKERPEKRVATDRGSTSRTTAAFEGPNPSPAAPAATTTVPAPKTAEAVPEWLSDLVGAGRAAHREIMIPQNFVARLIGRGGEVIMGICNQTGADVRIRQETKDHGYSLAVITGPEKAMDQATAMIQQKLGTSATGASVVGSGAVGGLVPMSGAVPMG